MVRWSHFRMTYEFFCIVPGEVTQDDATRTIDDIRQKIAAAGGSVDDITALGKQRLAYPIRHERFGYYYMVYVTMGAPETIAFRRDLERHPGLLRVFIRQFNPAIDKKARAEDLVFKRVADAAPAVAVARPERPAPAVAPFEEHKAASVEPLVQKEPAMAGAVSAEEIDKKLDELLESDLLPSETV